MEDNSEEKNKIEKKFHFLFENVTSVGIIDTSISLQLKLIVTYNLYWWLLFHSKKEFDEDQKEEYLQMIDAGLSRGRTFKKFFIFIVKIREKEIIHVLTVLGCSQTNTYLSTTEKIIENLNGLKKLSTSENSENVLLIVEIVVVVLMYIGNLGKKYLKKCANVATMFLVDLKETILSNESFDKFFKRNYPSHLFKFGLNKTATTLSEIHSSAVDYLQTLESVFLLLLGNFRDSLESVHKNLESSFSGLQTYIAALNCFKLNKINLCMGFINKTSLSNVQLNLKMRFLILKGQLCSANGNHKEAAKHFENTINICFSCPLPYYYAGHQWGKIGLNDLMVECFEKLLQVIVQSFYI